MQRSNITTIATMGISSDAYYLSRFDRWDECNKLINFRRSLAEGERRSIYLFIKVSRAVLKSLINGVITSILS